MNTNLSFKRLLATSSLFVVLSASCFTLKAHDYVVDNIFYNRLSNNTLEVTYEGMYSTSYKGEYSGDVVVPATVKVNNVDYTVVGVNESAFYFCDELTSVVLPEGLTYIEDKAFMFCDGLLSVTMPSTLETLGNKVFYYCDKIKSIEIPKSVSSIGSCLVVKSLLMEEIKVDEANPYYVSLDGVLYTKDLTKLLACPRGKELGDYVIPEGVELIMESAFESCSYLNSISMPSSLKLIETRAFTSCYNLKEIHVKASTPPTIMDDAFNSYQMLVFVPADAVDAYKSIDSWSRFAELHAEGTLVQGSRIEVDGIAYLVTETNKKVSVTSQGASWWQDNNYSGDMVIPSSIQVNGFTLDVIGIESNAFRGCDSLNSVSIPASVEYIHDDAFGAKNLQAIYVDENSPNFIVDAGILYSKDKSVLFRVLGQEEKSVVIPEGVKEVRRGAFEQCNIKLLVVPESVTFFAFSYFSSIEELHWNPIGLDEEQDLLFGEKGNPSLKTVVFGDKVERIPRFLCAYTPSLQSVVLPQSLKYIGWNAFWGSGIREIVIPEGVEGIEGQVFGACDSLTKVTWNVIDCGEVYEIFGKDGNPHVKEFIFGDKVQRIPDKLCYGMSSLQEVHLPASIKEIGMDAFNSCLSLESASLPIGLEVLKERTFYNCQSLKQIHLPAALKEIGKDAFYLCKQLKEVVIPEGMSKMGDNVFSASSITSVQWNAINCEILMPENSWRPIFPNTVETFVFGDKVEQIPDCVCYGLEKVSSINIPLNVKSIGEYAFYRCKAIEAIELPDSLVSIGNSAFKDVDSLRKVVLPAALKELGLEVFAFCDNLEEISFQDGIQTIPYGLLRSTAIKTLTIPSTVTKIEERAFSCCSNLVQVQLNEGLEEIGNSAFEYCSIKDLQFPSTLRKIRPYAFYHNKMEELLVPVGIDSLASRSLTSKYLKKIEWQEPYSQEYEYSSGPFSGSDSLHTIVLAEGVKTLGSYLFAQLMSLDTLVISASVSSIHKNTFYASDKMKTVTAYGDDYYTLLTDIDQTVETLLLPDLKTAKYIDFRQYKNLKKLDIRHVESMDQNILGGLSKLTELVLPYVGSGDKNLATDEKGVLGSLFGTTYNSEMKAVTQYYADNKSQTFYVSPNLTKLIIADGCTELSYGALSGMSTLKEVTLPASVYMVGEKAFYGCAGLEHVYCQGASPAAAFDNTFVGVRTATCVLHVPYKADELYARSAGWKDFYYIQAEDPIRVSVLRNIQHAGIILGLTEYEKGDMVSLKAIANSGYRFVAWMENDVEISRQDTIQFKAVENRQLMAFFVPVSNENNVLIKPEANTALISWQLEENVSSYTLRLYTDEAMTQLVATMQFDAEGQLITKSSSYVDYTIADLDAETNYYYQLEGRNAESMLMSRQIGSFATQKMVELLSEQAHSYAVYPNPVVNELQVEGLSVGQRLALYTADGRLLYQACASSSFVCIDMSQLVKGTYVLRIDDDVYKVVKQ